MSEDKNLLEMAKAVENEPERDFFEVMKEIGSDKMDWILIELEAAWTREKIMRKALEEISHKDIDNIAGESAIIADEALAKCAEGKME